MANSFNTRPIVVDTVMAGGSGIDQPLKVVKVYWFNPALAGDTLEIIDPVSSQKLLVARAEAVGQSQVFDFPFVVWKDFRVSVLSSGVVYIYTA